MAILTMKASAAR